MTEPKPPGDPVQRAVAKTPKLPPAAATVSQMQASIETSQIGTPNSPSPFFGRDVDIIGTIVAKRFQIRTDPVQQPQRLQQTRTLRPDSALGDRVTAVVDRRGLFHSRDVRRQIDVPQ